MENIFFDIGVIIIVGTLLAYIAQLLKQPLIPAYIVAGLLLGPVYGVITNQGVVATLSEIGIAFLLFIVGLEMDLKKIKDVWKVAGIGGLAGNLFIYTVAFIAALFLGFVLREAVYFGIIIALSSTMVVVKLLSDKAELSTVHGRIVIGFLLVQDLIAIIALSALKSLSETSVAGVLLDLGKGVLVIFVVFACTRYLFPGVFKQAAKNQELLFMCSVAACFLFALLAFSLNFSIAIGAFLAGLSLANLPYNFMIIGKVKSLRDFFATIFFVSLGMNLMVESVSGLLVPLLVILALVIWLKPVVFMFICSFFGYKKRIGFLSGLSMAQLSEFSLIIVAQGFVLGQVSQQFLTLTIIAATLTIGLSSYFFKYEQWVYGAVKHHLNAFEKIAPVDHHLAYDSLRKRYDVILCGQSRIGYSIARSVLKMKKSMLVVDYNPDTIKSLIKDKVACLYGDVGDEEILARLPFKGVKMVISTIQNTLINKRLIEKVTAGAKKATVYVTASDVEEALDLYDAGADYVVLPHFLGGDHVSLMIEEYSPRLNKLLGRKLKHIGELRQRRVLGHEHPQHH